MAMNPKLKEGSIIDKFYRVVKNGRDGYLIYFEALYVKNRRERTSGVRVPYEFENLLEKHSVRLQSTNNPERDGFRAVGCRSKCYYSEKVDMPFPTSETLDKANKEFELFLKGELRNAQSGAEFHVYLNDDIQKFNEEKCTNEDMLYVLQKPIKALL